MDLRANKAEPAVLSRLCLKPAPAERADVSSLQTGTYGCKRISHRRLLLLLLLLCGLDERRGHCRRRGGL